MHFSIGGIFRKILGVQKRFDKLERRISLLESALDDLRYGSDDPTLIGTRVIVPFLSGGIGNQLFQVSCAYSLSRKLNYLLRINYDMYASYGQGQHPSKYRNTIFQKVESTDVNPPYKFSYTSHEYKEITRLPNAHIKLEGYFQSSKYFGIYKEELRHLFVLPQEDLDKAAAFLDKDSRPAVGIHIRLGDYANHPGLQACDKDYYHRAIRQFSPDCRFIVCSDQPELACEMLKSPDTTSWTPRKPISPEIYNGTSELADLAMLSSCKQLILSNSTFSYWGYFLGIKKTQVVAPKRWFNSKVHKENHSDIYEKEWTLV